jgi:hypothetical protein
MPTPSTDANADTPWTDHLARHHITLRVGSELLPPTTPDLPASLRAAIDRHNASRRFPDLPDDLNAELLDPEKTLAFLRALPAQDAATTKQLEDRTLYLSAPDLGLSPATAYTPATLAAGYTLSVPAADKGRPVLPKLQAPVDVPATLPRIAAARRAVEQYDRQARQLETQLQQIDTDQHPDDYVRLANTLAEAKYRRFQSAITWRNLATAAATTDPHNATLKTESTTAHQSAQQFTVPPRH